MCENCVSSYGDRVPRDFTIHDLRPTLIRHGLENGTQVSGFAFCAFVHYMCVYSDTSEICYQRAINQLRADGYELLAGERCARLYRQGLRVLEELKKKGIKHKPRA